MKVFDDNFLTKVKEIIDKNSYEISNVAICDGKSYDGFISFTDGYVEATTCYYPHQQVLSFVEVQASNGKSNQDRVDKLNALIESWNSFDEALQSVYENDKEYAEQYGTLENFKDKFKANEFPEDLEELVMETYEDEYSDVPAYFKVMVMFYKNETNFECVIRTNLNDDFGYGRECAGAYFGKNIIDECYGDHIAFEDTFTFNTEDECLEKLPEYVEKAFETINFCY